MVYPHIHRSHRIGWLRASVMGANDGIVSTSSLLIGVAAAGATHENILLAGVAGLVSGAMSMAAGEYVSVSSQLDTEKADLAIEQMSLDDNFELEKEELAKKYKDRGLESQLAWKVADQLMAHDALSAHARDDIGISDSVTPQPVQAAFSSGGAFAIGAALPLLTACLIAGKQLIPFVAGLSLVFLMILGGVAARTGGSSKFKGATRVCFWGAMAMALTAVAGKIFEKGF